MMKKKLLHVFKWIGLSVASFLGLVVLAGLGFLLLSPKPHSPTGECIDVGGFKLHIQRSGEKNDKATMVIEGGGGLPTEFSYWLNEGLKDSMRVVRYDRAGIGHSDKCITPRDPETVARELHSLLEKAGESPPYIMMGHSIGGPYIRVFTELYPDEVEAMVFLDATHPDHVELYNAPKQTDFKYKGYIWSIEAQAVLSDLGVLALYDELFGTPYYGEGLPDEINKQFKDFLKSGKIFRAFKEEMLYYYSTLKRSGEVEDFGALPIRVFSAVAEQPDNSKAEEKTSQEQPKKGTHKDYADLSTNGTHTQIVGNHVTIFTKKENAAIICQEVLTLLKDLE